MRRRLASPTLRQTLTALAGLLSLCATAQTNEVEPAPAAPAPAPTAAVAKLPSVDELMRNLLDRLPSKPVLVSGELLTAPDDGEPRRLTISIRLRYPREATYTIGDAFGKALEQLTVTREGSQVTYTYLSGDPLAAAPAPSPGSTIQNTAMSWMDLTLGFLWWDGGRIIGREENRGQPCYVLDRHAPAQAMVPYASTRLWVDTRVSMLMEAIGKDKLENPVRRLSVKSFKKINHEWMVKDLEVENLSTHLITILRVRDVAADTPAEP